LGAVVGAASGFDENEEMVDEFGIDMREIWMCAGGENEDIPDGSAGCWRWMEVDVWIGESGCIGGKCTLVRLGRYGPILRSASVSGRLVMRGM